MRILILQPNLWNRKGAAPVLVMKNLAASLKPSHEFFFVSICKLEPITQKELFTAGHKVENLNVPKWLPIFRSKKLVSMIYDWKPDIIHINQLRSELLAASIKKHFPSISIISTKHGFYEYFDPSRKWPYSLLRLKALKYVQKSIDHTVCISHFEKGFYVSHGIPANKISVIHNGIQPTLLLSRSSTPTFNIITVGKLEPRKGMDKFIVAAKKVLQKGYKNCKFKIFGTGSEQTYLEKLILETGYGEYIKLMGFETNKDRIYTDASIYVHAASNEAFGLSIAEAMHYGLPVVSFNVDAVPEIIEHNVTGFLVPPNDIEKMAEKVEALMLDNKLLEVMSAKSHKRAIEEFSHNKMADKYANLYKEILDIPNNE